MQRDHGVAQRERAKSWIFESHARL